MRVPYLSCFVSFVALALLSACASTAVSTQATERPKPGPYQGPGYDLRLSNMDYPYETKVFSFESQGRNLEMVYMDVLPTGQALRDETVLLLHGKNFSGAYWAGTIKPLIQRGYRVVVPDQIGFGKSSKPGHFQYTFQGFASYTQALLDTLKVGKVHVVGHSMGGMVAARFALMFPDRTQSLILVNPIGLEDWKRVVPYKPFEWWFAREQAKTPEKVRAYMTSSYFDGQWKPAYEPLVDLQVGWIQGPDTEQIARSSAMTYEMIFTQPVVYEFNLIQAPTLLIIGDRDRTALGKNLVSEELRKTLGLYGDLARKAQAAIPKARLELLPGIGHIPQYEAYETYLALLTGFLDEQSASAKPAGL